jgi:hypothetical protein
MSLSAFRAELNEELLRFLWRQWSQLGVAGSAPFTDRWIIDPEALLVATLHFGRFDSRLFDEVMGWCVQNGRWISMQRLKNIAGQVVKKNPVAAHTQDEGVFARTLGGFALLVDSHESKPRWRTFVSSENQAYDSLIPLFLKYDGSPLPVWGETDSHFRRTGLERPIVKLRALSVPIPMESSSCLLLRLRALFGLSPRAEVSAYLLANGGARVPDVAHAAVYSLPAVREAMAELSLGGFAYGPVRGRTLIDNERWRMFLNLPAEIPHWIDWPRIFSAIQVAVNTLAQIDREVLSDYLLASRMLDLHASLQELLFNSGLSNPFLTGARLDNAAETLLSQLRQFINNLSAGITDRSRDQQLLRA